MNTSVVKLSSTTLHSLISNGHAEKQLHLSFVLYFCSQIVEGLRSPSAVAVDAITTGLQVRNHLDVRTTSRCLIDLFTDTAAILNLLDLRSRYRYGEHTEEGRFKLII